MKSTTAGRVDSRNNGPALMQFAAGSSQAAQERCAAVECDGARDRH
jgi:hypothetical protein